MTYVAGKTPGALLVERWSARRVIGTSMVAWGLALESEWRENRLVLQRIRSLLERH